VTLTAAIFLGLILARWAAQLFLERLNRSCVLARAKSVPEAFKGSIDEATYARSVQYTLARGSLGRWEDTWRMAVLAAILFSGVLPAAYGAFGDWCGHVAWADALFLLGTGVALSLPSLPWEWYEQFHLEDRFGFNTMSGKTWWLDRVKALGLATALGYPLLVLVLKFVDWTGAYWWLWAWGALLGFQCLMSVLAPVLILPLFNRFTPLPDGGLKERLMALAQRTGFRARSIQVMDGSRRSRHSNAFFTGLGRFRKIVLFDTLMQQLAEDELEAVLAHEIGHFRMKHITKMLLVSAVASLAGFWVVARLAEAPWFLRAFGFAPGDSIAPALLLFSLLSGALTFWLSPLAHAWSRRYEYQADAFAAVAMGEWQSLVNALRKLNEKNLGNLTPHPVYSGFYYSHPTLIERERALGALRMPVGAGSGLSVGIEAGGS
jgi:STE24 endopeptidase